MNRDLDVNQLLEELIQRLDKIAVIERVVRLMPPARYKAAEVYAIVSSGTGLIINNANTRQFAEVLIAHGWAKTHRRHQYYFEKR